MTSPPLPQVTASAASQISKILKAEAQESGALRVSVLGGGCSGFQYKFDLVDGPQADDQVVERDGVRVVVDPVSLPFLEGATIDFVNDLIGVSFQIDNPNATSSCGCGTSFSV